MVLDRFLGAPGAAQSSKTSVLLKENNDFWKTAESAPGLFSMSFGSNFGVVLSSFLHCFLLFFRSAIFTDFGLHFGIILGCFFTCFRGRFLTCFLERVFGGSLGHATSNVGGFGTSGEGEGEG